MESQMATSYPSADASTSSVVDPHVEKRAAACSGSCL